RVLRWWARKDPAAERQDHALYT
ncbi:hypothetical protein XPU_0099, partial [Xanthomonas arboricola pv. pruni str. MAFF 311562]